MKYLHKKKEEGYIVIIVLLLTAVLLMLGLSLATRTTEEVYLSGQEADTTRVFNAAETGIENALYLVENTPGLIQATPKTFTAAEIAAPDGSDSNLQVTGEQTDTFDMNIPQGEVLTLKWKPGTRIITKYANCAAAPALIVTLYDPVAIPKAYHVTYNPVSAVNTSCSGKGTNFQNSTYVSATSSSVTLDNSTFGITPNGNALIRIRPLFADASFTIEDSAAIKIVSTASDTSGGSGTSAETRKIQVIRTEPAPPSIFDYAVFSGGSLTK